MPMTRSFLPRAVFGLDENDFRTAEVLEHFDQPLIESTDFHNRPESTSILQAHSSDRFEERHNFVRLDARLLAKHDISVFISQADS